MEKQSGGPNDCRLLCGSASGTAAFSVAFFIKTCYNGSNSQEGRI